MPRESWQPVAGIAIGAGRARIAYVREGNPDLLGSSVEINPVDHHGMPFLPAAAWFDEPPGRGWVSGGLARSSSRRLGSPMPWLDWPGHFRLGPRGRFPFDGAEEEPLSPARLLALIVERLARRVMEIDPTTQPPKVLLTVPRVSDPARRAVAEACALVRLARDGEPPAPLELLGVIDELDAAATQTMVTLRAEDPTVFARVKNGEPLLICDWGSAKVRLSVLAARPSRRKAVTFDLLGDIAVAGIGGAAIDVLIAGEVLRQWRPDDRPSRERFEANLPRLLQDIEQAKQHCSSAVGDPFPFIDLTPFGGAEPELDRSGLLRLLRAEFADRPWSVEERFAEACLALRAAAPSVRQVILCGGSSRLPICEAVVRDVFGAGVQVHGQSAQAEQIVVHGAAIRAAQLSGIDGFAPVVTVERGPRLADDLDVQLGADASTRRRLLHAGLPLPLLAPATMTLWTAREGRAVLRCLARAVDRPYEMTRPAERDLLALDLGDMPASAPIEVSGQTAAMDGGREVEISASSNGRRFGPVRARWPE